MCWNYRFCFILIGTMLLSISSYSQNLLYREYTPVSIGVDSRGDSETGSVCHAGDLESPTIARELQDERLLTWRHIETSEERYKVIQATFEQPVHLGQAVFDFLVYNGDCFAPRGETRFQLLDGKVWNLLEISHVENWSEAESIGPSQRMGRVQWIYNLGGRTCSGFRLLFSSGLEDSVICSTVSAFEGNPAREQARRVEPVRGKPAVGENLLPFVPYSVWFFSSRDGERTMVGELPFEFALGREGRSVSLQLTHPLMLSRLEVKYKRDDEVKIAAEVFLEGQRVSIAALKLRQNEAGTVITLAPVAVDRIDFTFFGQENGRVNLVSLAASLDEAGRKSLRAVEDAPDDIWAKRVMEEGEPSYTDSAALMLPRRDYRTVVGFPDDLDETAVAWNGTLFLRRREDPRGRRLARFFAFRLDSEDFGKDFDALQGGWTSGAEQLSPGSLPERWIRYEKDGVSATVRSFAGVDTEGEGTHLLWVEVSLQNHGQRPREGFFEAATGLRRCGKSGQISPYWDLPVFDQVLLERERLLVDALGQPILWADRGFELVGTDVEPACRFAYQLEPGGLHHIRLAAVVDCRPEKSYLPKQTLQTARGTFSKFWNRKLDSGLRIKLPEQRLQEMYPQLLAQCLITPDRGVPKYGSYFYEDTLCVEEVWPTVALAQYGFFDEAHQYAQAMLEISADDQRTRHKQYRKGLAPACAWSVYQYSRDRDFLQRVFPLMRTCSEYIMTERRKTMVFRGGEKTGYYGLLPRFVYGGDIDEAAYGLYANACAWRGLRDSALAAADLGDTALAGRWRKEADSYYTDIMAVVERVTDRKSTPIFTPLSLGRNSKDPDEAFPSGDATPQLLHQDQISSYWPLFASLLLETGLFEPDGEYASGMLEVFSKKAGLWDGQVRFAYVESNWDPHYGYGLHRTWQRRDERNLFLTAFYGFLANNMSRDSWVHGEVSNVFPMRVQNFAQRETAYDRIWRQPGWKGSEPLSSGPGILLSDLRDMLVYENRDQSDEVNGGLSLLRFAPGAWLVDDQDIVVEDAPTAYGKLCYRAHCELEQQRRIVVSMNLDSQEPVLLRVFAFPSNFGNLLKAEWSDSRESTLGVNWTEAAVRGKAEVTLQF